MPPQNCSLLALAIPLIRSLQLLLPLACERYPCYVNVLLSQLFHGVR